MRDHAARLGLREPDHVADAERVLDPAGQRGRRDRAAGDAPGAATETSRLARSGWPSRASSMVGTPHSRVTRCASMSSSSRAGEKRGMSTWVAVRLDRAEGEQRAAAHVEQRHRVDLDVAGADAAGLEGQPRVVGQATVGEHRALGPAGGARGVEHLRRGRRARRRAAGLRAGRASPAAVNASQSAKRQHRRAAAAGGRAPRRGRRACRAAGERTAKEQAVRRRVRRARARAPSPR